MLYKSSELKRNSEQGERNSLAEKQKWDDSRAKWYLKDSGTPS